MLKSDSIIRPRKITTVNYLDKYSKNGTLPVYRIPDIRDHSHSHQSEYRETDLDPKKGKRNNKGIYRKVLGALERYCENTSLHGLRYVGDTSLSLFERLFWLISFSVAIGFAAYYISNIYEKWNSSPVIISFSPFDAPLKSIPFPSVTICNMNQAKKTEVNKIKDDGNPMDLKLLDDICEGDASNRYNNYTEQYDWTKLRNFLIRVGSSCSDMVKGCKWSSDKKNCDDLFNNDLTDEGLCCSFNRLPPNKIFRNPNDISLLNQTYPENVYDWNPEIGFPDMEYDDENMVPKRPLGAGAHLGLSVLLDAQIDEYYCSSTNSIGFKIIISNPIETPKMADYGTLLSPGVEARFSIRPSVREASANLRNVPLKKRQCYFASERKLVYYRIYSKMNCQQECLSTIIYSRCGCSPYFLPRNSSMKYCQQSDDNCVGRVKIWVEKEVYMRLSCNCYSECNSLLYTWKLSHGNLNVSLTSTMGLIDTTNTSNASYTQTNCNLECQSNYTYEKCHCIPYFLPRNKSIRACGRKDHICADNAKENMEKETGNGTSCNCLPGCFGLKFTDSKSYGKLSRTINSTEFGEEWNINITHFENNMAVVHFYFSSSHFSKIVKAELYGFTEILSNVGGLLGLCMGFSFLSVVEILYFITIRWFIKWIKNKKKHEKKKNKKHPFFKNEYSRHPFLK